MSILTNEDYNINFDEKIVLDEDDFLNFLQKLIPSDFSYQTISRMNINELSKKYNIPIQRATDIWWTIKNIACISTFKLGIIETRSLGKSFGVNTTMTNGAKDNCYEFDENSSED